MNALASKEEVYIDYYNKVMHYVAGKIKNRHEVDDIVSEIFLKVNEKFDTFDAGKSSISTWIYTIARNTVIDYYRVSRPHAELPEELSSSASVEDDILRRESLESLASAIEGLDERLRDLIILRYYSGCTLKEIAAKMQVSYSYIKILHNSALRELKKSVDFRV